MSGERKPRLTPAEDFMNQPATEAERAAVAAKHRSSGRAKPFLAAGFKRRPRVPRKEGA